MKNKPQIGVLMYTFNRADDARINMELIRNLWSKNEFLNEIKLLHVFNGEKSWWPEKYLEDELVYCENEGHFKGAENLLNAGVLQLQQKYPDLDYVIVLAPDTWFIKPEFLSKLIVKLRKGGQYFAASVWGSKKNRNVWEKGSSLDFCIFDAKWIKKAELFPLNYQTFLNQYEELFMYEGDSVFLERVVWLRFMQGIKKTEFSRGNHLLREAALNRFLQVKEREPIHVRLPFWIRSKYRSIRKVYWPKIGLVTHHVPEPKRKILKNANLSNLGEHIKKLCESKDLSYWNNGQTKPDETVFKK